MASSAMGLWANVSMPHFKERSRLHVYDPAYLGYSNEFEDSPDAVWEKVEFVFICVPTPQRIEPDAYGGPFDGSAVDHCVESLGLQVKNPSKAVILTSTTLPSRIAEYQKEWPHLRLVVCPEFGRERAALEDYLNPKFRILGGNENDAKAVQSLFTEFSTCAPCPVGFCDANRSGFGQIYEQCFFSHQGQHAQPILRSMG